MIIPRRMHFVWVGPLQIPDRFLANIESWKIHHPGWDIKLWKNDVDSLLPKMQCGVTYNQCSSWVRKSDIARLELLRVYGGVYMDCDIQCLRNIEPLLENVKAFAAYEDSVHICNAAMGCIPMHPWIIKAVQTIPSRAGIKARAATGRAILTQITPLYKDVTVFGCDTFFPRKADSYPDTVYAIHEWANHKN